MEMIRGGECGTFNPLLMECLKDIEDQLQLRPAPSTTLLQSRSEAKQLIRRL